MIEKSRSRMRLFVYLATSLEPSLVTNYWKSGKIVKVSSISCLGLETKGTRLTVSSWVWIWIKQNNFFQIRWFICLTLKNKLGLSWSNLSSSLAYSPMKTSSLLCWVELENILNNKFPGLLYQITNSCNYKQIYFSNGFQAHAPSHGKEKNRLI